MESVRDASWSVSAETNDDPSIKPLPEWVRSWEDIGLIAWVDKDGDGAVDYAPGAAFVGKPSFAPDEARGDHGERVLVNEPTDAKNELYVDRDIMVLANPEISGLPDWVVRWLPPVVWRRPSPPRRVCCWWCRPVFLTTCSSAGCFPTSLKRESCGRANFYCGCGGCGGLVGDRASRICCGGGGIRLWLGREHVLPRDRVGHLQYPHEQARRGGGNGHGPSLTASAIVWFRFLHPELDTAEHWWFGIGPKGIGSVGMLLNFVVSVAVGACFPARVPARKTWCGPSGFPKERVPRPRTDLESTNAARTPAAGRRCSS